MTSKAYIYFMIFHDISWYFMYHLLGFSIITFHFGLWFCTRVTWLPMRRAGWWMWWEVERQWNSWEIAGSVVGIAVTYWLWLRLSAQPAEVLDKFDKFLKYYSYCQLLQFSGLSDSYECKCPFIVILVGAIEVINGYNHGRSLRSGDIVEACRGYNSLYSHVSIPTWTWFTYIKWITCRKPCSDPSS